MSEILHGLYTADLRELLILGEAFKALEAKYRTGGTSTPDIALELQRKVAALTTAATAARRAATAPRNPQGNTSTGSGEVVTVNQAAQLIGITEQAVRKNCATGRLDAGKADDNSWLISRSSVDQLTYAKEAK